MSNKNTKNAAAPEATTSTIAPTKAAQTTVLLTADVIARMRSADSIDTAVHVLAPTTRRASSDARYRLNTECPEPLPQQRGACVKVVAVAVRLDRPFKVADVTEALPDVKSAAYWTRRLAKTGHFIVMTD
jgi:hypothetical protein